MSLSAIFGKEMLEACLAPQGSAAFGAVNIHNVDCGIMRLLPPDGRLSLEEIAGRASVSDPTCLSAKPTLRRSSGNGSGSWI